MRFLPVLFGLIVSWCCFAQMPPLKEYYEFLPIDRGIICEGCSSQMVESKIRSLYPMFEVGGEIEERLSNVFTANVNANQLNHNLYVFNSGLENWIKYKI